MIDFLEKLYDNTSLDFKLILCFPATLSFIFSLVEYTSNQGFLSGFYLGFILGTAILLLISLVINGLSIIYSEIVFGRKISLFSQYSVHWEDIFAGFILFLAIAFSLVYWLGFFFYWFPIFTSIVIVLMVAFIITMVCHRYYLKSKEK